MIGKVIKSKFDSDATLNGIFSGKVYPFLAAQGASAPFAVYEIFRVNPSSTKDADSHLDEVSVRLTLVATTYSVCQDAVEGVRSAFPRMSDTVAGVNVQSCAFDNLRDVYSDSDEFYGVQVDLTFRIVRQ
jgi:hypothetical protein